MKKTVYGNAEKVMEVLSREGVRFGVSLGRRAPMHCMHVDCILDIVRAGLVPVIVMGSVNGADSVLYNPVKNPLTVEQQKEQFRIALAGVSYKALMMEDYVSDADWMKRLMQMLKDEGIYDSATMHFRAKAADAADANKTSHKPLSQYTDVFTAEGVTVWQSYNENPEDDNINASDIRRFDLENLTPAQRALMAAPDYIVSIARAARADNPDKQLLEKYKIPLSVLDLAFDRMYKEAGIGTASIIAAAEKTGEGVTLLSLEQAALALVKERQAQFNMQNDKTTAENVAENVIDFPVARKPLLVLGNSVSPEMAKILADSGLFDVAGVSLGKFQSDENFAELFYADKDNVAANASKISGNKAYVVQSTAKPVTDNTQYLLETVHTLKWNGAAEVTAVLPFAAYARQDRAFDNRFTSVAADLMAKQLKAAGADKVISFTMHSQAAIGFYKQVFGEDNFIAVSATDVFAGYLRRKFGETAAKEIVCGAPDGAEKPNDEGQKRANELANTLSGHFNTVADNMFRISKVHTGVNDTKVTGFSGDVVGKNCVVIDDMIDGGGTMLNAARTLKQQGAGTVTCMATHAILTGGALSALEKLLTAKEGNGYAIDRLVVTDSIPEAAEKIAAFRRQYPALADKVEMITLGDALADVIRNQESIKKPAKAAAARAKSL